MAISGPGESKDFKAEDVGNFLQTVLGDRLVEEGGQWDVEGVTVTHDDEKNGAVVVSGLNHDQHGTRWVKGVKSVQSIFELLAGKGYNASYVSGISTITIFEGEFAGVKVKEQVPDFVADAGEEKAFRKEGMLAAIDKALD